uniref:Uncharacterized protein n=1 Tax=Poecilia formosa TaxID=48698 RepID=A0A087XD50_POEFO
MLAVAAAKVVVAVAATVAASLVAIAASVRSTVPSVAATVVAATAAISVVVASAIFPASVAILISSHAAARSAPRRHCVPARGLHLLFSQGFLHLHFVSINGVKLHHHGLICRVMVGEVHESEAPLLPRLLLGDDFRLLHLAVLREIVGQMLLFDVVFQPTDENSLYLHRVTVDGVRPSSHGGVGLLRRGVGNKAE